MGAADRRTPHPRRDWIAAGVLAGAAVLAFAPALDCGFVNLDDPDYVTRNKVVLDGLSGAGLRLAFTSSTGGNWHPLTWLSLELDATLWRTPDGAPNPFGFHLTSVLLHAASAALLFLALHALTGAFWRSAAAALLFAVHPLRVESVAWVAERKDVLSVFFGLLALWAYSAYVRQPSAVRYLAVAGLFALSLMSKPMLVTLPFLLLVLDWWPLQRWSLRRTWLLLEKVPLFALSVASSALTYFTQSTGGAVMDLETFSPLVRVENAAVSYVQYLLKTAWPFNLAVYYPHPAYPWGGGLPPWKVAAAAVLLAALTAGAVLLRRRAPYLLAGWLWYLGTLVPVIGLVQVGDQAYADRYSYFPQVGLLLALCWGTADLARRNARAAVAVTAVAALALAVATRAQLQSWHDSTALWNHDLRAAGPSPLAYMNLGVALGDDGKTAEAIDRVRKAVELRRTAFLPHVNLGELLSRAGDLNGADEEYKIACEIRPDSAQLLVQRGNVLSRLGKLDEAAELMDQATKLAPDSGGAWCNLGLVEMTRKHYDHSRQCFLNALGLQPDSAEAHCGLGQLLLLQDDNDPRGLAELREAVRCNPRYGEGHLFLGMALYRRRDPGCIGHLEQAVTYSPGIAEAWFQLGRARAAQGLRQEAVDCLSMAVKLDPNREDYQITLANARKRLGSGRPGLPPVPGATP